MNKKLLDSLRYFRKHREYGQEVTVSEKSLLDIIGTDLIEEDLKLAFVIVERRNLSGAHPLESTPEFDLVLDLLFLPVADERELSRRERLILVRLILRLTLLVDLLEGTIRGGGLQNLGEQVAAKFAHINLFEIDHAALLYLNYNFQILIMHSIPIFLFYMDSRYRS